MELKILPLLMTTEVVIIIRKAPSAGANDPDCSDSIAIDTINDEGSVMFISETLHHFGSLECKFLSYIKINLNLNVGTIMMLAKMSSFKQTSLSCKSWLNEWFHHQQHGKF